MNIFTFLFQEVLYRPVLNLLVFFYNLPFVDLGIAIIFLTVLIRLILWPLNSKAIKNQRDTQIKTKELQDKIKEIQEKYKSDPSRQNEELTKFLREKKLNPFASFLPMIIQIVVLIALYQALRNVLQPEGLSLLYSFVPKPNTISPMFFRVLDLSKTNWPLAILTGVAQYFASKTSFNLQAKELKDKEKAQSKQKKNKKDKKTSQTEEMQKRMQKMMQGQMLYFMPVLTIVICFTLPAALPLYWLLSSCISIIQQKIIFQKL